MSSQSYFFNPQDDRMSCAGSGLQLPRLSSTQRLGLVVGINDSGLQVFDTTLQASFVWTGTTWVPSSGSSGEVDTVDNITALKAQSVVGLPDGQVIMTRGYYTENDGGQGTYVYDSTSVAADNGGTVIAPNAGVGRYLLLTDGTVNLLQFGAKRDGTTDNLAPFRSAVAYINSIGGGTIYVPNGNFAFDLVHSGAFNLNKTILLCSNLTIVMSAGTTLSVLGAWSAGVKYALFCIASLGLYPTPSNIVIEGFGAKLNGINPNQANDPGVTHGLLFLDQNSSGITVRDLTVQNWGTCAKLNGKNMRIESCTFTNANNNCVAVTDGDNIIFHSCRFLLCSGPAGGSLVQAGLDIEANAGESVDNIQIVDCEMLNNGSKGLYFQQGAGTSSRLSLSGCAFENNGNYGAVVTGTSASLLTDVVITGNRFRNNGTLGVANDSQLIVSTVNGATISNNEVYGNSTSFGLRLIALNNASVSGNTILNSGGATNVAGLYFLVCNNVSVVGNTVNGGAKNGLYIAGGSGINVTGNSVSQTAEENVLLRGDCTNVYFSGNLFAEPCLVSGGQFVVASLEQVGFITWSGNRFAESLRYNSGTVAAYVAGPPTTIQLADLASDQNEYYTGYYVLVGTVRIQITAYNGSTRTATLASAFGTAPTPGTSVYRIVPVRSVNIVINNAGALNGLMQFEGVDWINSGATVPFFGTGPNLNPTWSSSTPVSVSANYTATLFDDVILVDATGGARTVTLPTVANARCMNKTFTIKKVDASANAVIVDGNGAETIDGALTQSLLIQWSSITVRGDSTSWSVTAVK